jgi:hypothetical protein
MEFNFGSVVGDEMRAKVDAGVQAALAKIGKGMQDFLEDDETFKEVVDIGYEALPLPIRLGLRKESFRKIVVSLKDRYLTEGHGDGETPITKTEHHVTFLPTDIDEDLTKALGHLVVACGRLEGMLKLAIKREQKKDLAEVVREFDRAPLGTLIRSCRERCPNLKESCDKADQLNQHRQDFIHATLAATDEGGYVRFRKLVGYQNLENDIETIMTITKEVNALIQELDTATGSLVPGRLDDGSGVIKVSALGSPLT